MSVNADADPQGYDGLARQLSDRFGRERLRDEQVIEQLYVTSAAIGLVQESELDPGEAALFADD